ncbi:MAG TPA: hypothetical protein VK703_06640 [Candidatus Acidoferrales bacterium]|jgi:hypothetical protein|nr:hypothetical protein [Candidatus Acidoferrales bacterium]
MLRSAVILVVIAVSIATPTRAQDNATALQAYFSGKQVTLKIDMPGTQKGVDLRFNKPTPMDWKEYGSRIKQFGVAIQKGEVARITTIVVKRDMIEFQLNGGGFGVAGDDTSTTVTAKPVEKSAYEKDLENQIANTDDPDKKASLQHDLDRERARRERQDANNQRQAQYASQQKAAVVEQNRATGGSRFNLRWSGSIPAEQLTPEGVMQCLSEYVSFTTTPPPTATAAPDPNAAPATAKLKRGMSIEDVTTLFGPGKPLSESVGDAGLKTQIFEYTTSDRRVNVTYVDGLVVRYTISSL